MRQVWDKINVPDDPDILRYAVALWDDNHQLSFLDRELFLSEILGIQKEEQTP